MDFTKGQYMHYTNKNETKLHEDIMHSAEELLWNSKSDYVQLISQFELNLSCLKQSKNKNFVDEVMTEISDLIKDADPNCENTNSNAIADLAYYHVNFVESYFGD